MSMTAYERVWRPAFRTLLGFCLISGLIAGCQATDDDFVPAKGGSPGAEILATLDGQPISASSVDAPLRLDLHDLDIARYERRRDRLRLLITERLGSGIDPDSVEWKERVEILLEPPPAPRLEIPDDPSPMRGPEKAPVTIVEFVDFESAHCRRLQPELIRVLDRYPGRVRLVIRDLPLPYHRYAGRAATSAHCAAEQGAYWAYHDLLLFEQPQLSVTDLTRYAGRLGLDSMAFDACLDSGRHRDRIARDLALAATLGVRRAATVFVNGLYLSGHPTGPAIERVVRSELARLGVDSNPSVTSARGVTGQSREPAEADAGKDSVLPAIPPELLAEPEAIVTLSRAEVDLALRDRRQLDRKLEAGAGEFSGQRLLKVRTIEEGDFLSRLGLEERDVLMIVNGEFMTVDHNSIWDAFGSVDTVKILIMRRGLPHTYEYRIR